MTEVVNVTVLKLPPTKSPVAPSLALGLALPLAVYLALSLTILGFTKYFYILAGGKKFATFPNSATWLGISLTYLALVILHALWVVISPRSRMVPNFSTVIRHSLFFLLLALIAYPLGNDVYLYLHAGLMNRLGLDPFTTPAGEFLSPLTPFVDWKQTSTYGPLSQILFSFAAIALPIHPIAAIYLLKLLCLGLHILNGWLVWKTVPPLYRGKAAIAYLLCPVLLMEQVASVHVDILVNTSVLLTALCLARQRYALAFPALWGGFLAKTIPLIWLPLFGLFLIRQQRWKSLLAGMGLSAAIAIVLTLTVLPTPAAWYSLLNPGVTGQMQSSLPALVRAGWETLPFFYADAPIPSEYRPWLADLTRYLLGVFALFYGFTCWRMFRRPYTMNHLLEDMGWVTLVLMLYGTAWLMPWYVSVLYAIAAVLPRAHRFRNVTLMFGISSSAMYVFQGNAGLQSLCAVGLPTLVLIASHLQWTRPSPSLPPQHTPNIVVQQDRCEG